MRKLSLEDGESGQSTLEFAIVALVVVAIATGIYAIAQLCFDGRLLSHAILEASHTVGQPNAGVVGDIAFF